MSQVRFSSFIWKEKRNRQFAMIALLSVILQFIIFKYLYPFADFFSDSYSYIFGASAHLSINIWPIGYSKFLGAFHEFTHSDTIIVGVQYFLLELSSLYFFFTILYFYAPGRVTRNILFAFLFFDPLFLYISNYINSDPLFAALSLLWLTELLWIIHRPKVFRIFTHAVLLYLCFTVRNNAYYYPIVSLLAFALSRESIKFKLAGIGFPLLFIGLFVIHTRDIAEEMTGTKQFSLFTGWQLANNALYMRGHIQVDSTKLPSADSRELDRLSRNFYTRVPDDFDSYLSEYGANFFIRESKAPLKQYYSQHDNSKTELDEVANWGKSSVAFGEYGEWLIRHYPLSFARHFMLVNTKNYFFPPLEKLEIYNLGDDEVGDVAEDWFDYKTPEVSSISKTIQGKILAPFPYFFFFLNVFLLGSLIWLYAKRKSLHLDRQLCATFWVSTTLLAANFCFCVFATIIVMRYQFFPMLVTLTFPLLLVEILERKTEVSLSPVGSSIDKPISLQIAKG